jgi:alcohol dehydrogenase class IV
VVSLVGDSIIDKKTFCIQLLEALKKDGIKAAIFDSEKEEYTISILNVVEEFLKEKECEIPWQQSDGDCKVKKQELIERLRKFL